MEEKIYQKLIAGLKNSPLTERTIRAYAKELSGAITTDEQLTDAVIKPHIVLLTNMGGQLNKEVAEKVKEQVEKLQTPPAPPAPPTLPTPPAPPEPPENGLEARLLAMEQRFQESQREQRKKQILEEVKERMKEQNATKSYILNNVLSKVQIGDNETADQVAARCIPLYDQEYREAYGEGAIPRNPQGENGLDAEAGKQRLLEFKKTKETKK